MTDREARFRRILRIYPRAYRAAREDEMLATMLDASPPHQRGPTPADVLDVGRRGLQLRVAGIRHHPLWAASVLAVITALAALLVVVTVASPPAFVSIGVPWANAPVSASYAHALTLPIPQRPNASAPRCVADELELVGVEPASGGGMEGLMDIVVRNVGSTSCVLRGTPRVTAYSATAPPLAVRPTSSVLGGPWTDFGEVADITPGHTVVATLVDFEGCSPNTQQRYDELVIELPGGYQTSVPLADTVYCDNLSVTPFFTWKPPETFYSFPSTELRGHLRLPASVAHGTTLRFDVELTNPTDHPVSFSPCPVYEVSATDFAASTPARYFRLACAGIPPLAAHHSRYFQMQLEVPERGAGHNLWVSWQFVAPFSATRTWGHVAVT